MRARGDGAIVKPHIGSKIIGFAMVFARLREIGWGAPAEGMSKVMPGLSKKFDKQEIRKEIRKIV